MLSYARTGNVPQALASRPVVTPDVAYLLECFSLLSRHRQSGGFGVNPIPLVDVVAASAPLGFYTPPDFLFFAEIMGDMDRVFMDYAAEQQKLASATKPKHR